MKKILAIVVMVFGFQMLSDSKKKFIKELLRQVPYLIPRYFV